LKARFKQLRSAYQSSRVETKLTGHSPYHDRLRTAETNGLYRKVLSVVDSLGPRFRNRLDNISLKELDENKLIPAVALMLSLRWDAMAARDALPTTDNGLQLAALVGHTFGDWPTATVLVTTVPGGAGRPYLMQMQMDSRYLATAYPSAQEISALREPLARAAWPIEGSTTLAQSLMYSVIRRESAYFSSAISPAGALGLFQVMPGTFESQPNCRQRQATGVNPSPQSYLFDPNRNIQFWSCWIRQEVGAATRENVALLLMVHHAGMSSLREWQKMWMGRAFSGDLELQIEGLRFPATQVFVRQVLADTSIADSSGLFESKVAADQQTP
jgi:hypothetical protein